MKELAQLDLVRCSARPGSWSSGFLASWRLECIYRSDPFAVVPSSSHQVDSENRTAKRSCCAFSKMVFLFIHAFPCILAPSTLTSLPTHISTTDVPYTGRILFPHRNTSPLQTCFTSRAALSPNRRPRISKVTMLADMYILVKK